MQRKMAGLTVYLITDWHTSMKETVTAEPEELFRVNRGGKTEPYTGPYGSNIVAGVSYRKTMNDATDNSEEKDAKGNCVRKERYTGSCNRSFYVGDRVTQEDIKAAFKDGVLALQVPKDVPKAVEQPKLITIE